MKNESDLRLVLNITRERLAFGAYNNPPEMYALQGNQQMLEWILDVPHENPYEVVVDE